MGSNLVGCGRQPNVRNHTWSAGDPSPFAVRAPILILLDRMGDPCRAWLVHCNSPILSVLDPELRSACRWSRPGRFAEVLQ
jgi:hypothetical protein